MTPTEPRTQTRYHRDVLTYAPARAVLLTVGRYQHLTAKQVTRALFADRSHTYTQRFLRKLTAERYLVKSGSLMAKTGSRGMPATLWTPTPKGIDAIRVLGQEPPHKTHHIQTINPLSAWHLHAVNDVLIHVALLNRDDPRVGLRQMRHQEALKRAPTPVTLPCGTRVNVEPDGFVDLDVAGYRVSFCLELDRGSEHRLDKWVPKIRGLIAYGAGPFREALGTDTLKIAVVARCMGRPSTKTDPERLEDLLAWTEQELTERRLQNWGAYFRMTVWDGTLSPADFFGSNRWASPFDRRPTPLIPQLGGAA